MASEEFRSSPEVRTGFVKGNTFGYRPIQYYVIDGQAIFEGDIVLDSVDGMERLVADVIAETGVAAGVVITGEQFRWPGGIVPFTIDPALPDVARVNDAILHWHERTSIRLIPRTNEQNFVTFRPGGGCSSQVGMRGGQQFITLAPGCDRGSTIHEIGHAVGIWHEQSREDRDRFIRILWQNITPGMEHNFAQHIADGDDVGPYDFGSIMHYPTWAFSRNNQPTIETLNGEAIGQRNGLSDGDIQAINFMYPIVPTFPNWQLLDNNPASTAIVADGNDLYQLHNNGLIWKYVGPPLTGWELLDNNPATKEIVAAGGNLYQIHSNGNIWKYVGPPMTGWELLDNNPASTAIVADGNDLYQLHNNGLIWKYVGPPLTGWELLDNNPATKEIVAAGGNLYQIHSNGNIWKYVAPPITGWQQLDNNPASVAIVAASNNLYQIHNNGNIWRHTG